MFNSDLGAGPAASGLTIADKPEAPIASEAQLTKCQIAAHTAFTSV